MYFSRKCERKYKCNSAQPCRDIKLKLWKERPGLYVSSCRPQCCSSDYCNHPLPTLTPPKTSTRKILPTLLSHKFPKKCFEIKPKFVSKLVGRKPREKNCSKNGTFDSCFSLQAQVLDNTTGKIVETAVWKDCATNHLDCHAITNRCAKVRELAESQGAYVGSCVVSCCDKDLCNVSSMNASLTRDQIKANRSRRASEFSILVVVLSIGITGLIKSK